MNLATGVVTKIMSTDRNFDKAVGLVKMGRFDEVESLTVKGVLNKFSEKSEGTAFTVRLSGGKVVYRFNGGEEKALNNAMTSRVIRMAEDGYDVDPLINFMTNLLNNPSKTSIDELYLFLEATGLPITSDGHFIAYKIVRDDYTSIHDATFRNDVGTVCEMPRHEVDDNRDRTCSYGLHFCSKEYLNQYGSGSRDTDRLVLVKINPADVVSIPSDYNNAKGRASKYLIWKDITEDGWRTKFTANDYTDAPVQEMFELEVVDLDDGDLDTFLDNISSVVKALEAADMHFSQDEVVCPECGSGEVHKKGTNQLADGTLKQRYKCQYCGNPFSKEI
jgi:DNA-directed RNA polymerase subunit RPC12/RpoP